MNTFASNSATTSASSIGPAAEMQIFARAAELWSWVPAKATIFSLDCLENWMDHRPQGPKQQALRAASILSIPWYHDKDWPTMRNCFQLDTFDWSYLLSLANPETRKVEEIWRTASYNKSGAPAPVNDLGLLRCLAVSHPSVCTMIHRNIVDFIHGY